MIFYWTVHISLLLPWISTCVDAISTRASPIGTLNDSLMHSVVMDSNMKYKLTWTPRDDDIVFQIEVSSLIHKFKCFHFMKYSFLRMFILLKRNNDT